MTTETHMRPVGDMTCDELHEDLRACDEEINSAYWQFTRCANGKPPVLQVPHAYARRKELEKEIGKRYSL